MQKKSVTKEVPHHLRSPLRALIKYVPFSQYKLRPYAEVIRNKHASYALQWLRSERSIRGSILYKAVASAVANAKNKDKLLDERLLMIDDIRVDQGPTRRSFAPSAQGRAKLQRTRFCHIFVSLAVGKRQYGVGKRKEVSKVAEGEK